MGVKYSGNNFEFFELPLYLSVNGCFSVDVSFRKIYNSAYSPKDIIFDSGNMESEFRY